MNSSSNQPRHDGGVSISGQIDQVGGSIVGGDCINYGGTKIVLSSTTKELNAALTKAIVSVDALKSRSDKFTTKKRKIFRKYIEPVFIKLQIVIEAYDADLFLLRTKMMCAQSSGEAADALQDYWKARRKTAKERAMLIATLEATLDYWKKSGSGKDYSESSDRIFAFIEALRNYFVGTRFMHRRDGREYAVSTDEAVDQASGSLATNLFRHVETILRYNTDSWRQDSIFMLDHALQLTMDRNLLLNSSYSNLKLNCEDIFK